MITTSTPFLVTYILLWSVVGILVIAVFALYHHFGEMYSNTREGRGSQGPKLFEEIGSVSARTLAGESIELPLKGRPTLLLYTTTTCPLCNELIPAVKDFARHRSDVSVVVVCAATPGDVSSWANGLSQLAQVVPDAKRVIAARYRIDATPFLIGIDSGGVVQTKGFINDATALETSRELLFSTGEVRDD